MTSVQFYKVAAGFGLAPCFMQGVLLPGSTGLIALRCGTFQPVGQKQSKVSQINAAVLVQINCRIWMVSITTSRSSKDRRLPKVGTTQPAGPGGTEVECRTIPRDVRAKVVSRSVDRWPKVHRQSPGVGDGCPGGHPYIVGPQPASPIRSKEKRQPVSRDAWLRL